MPIAKIKAHLEASDHNWTIDTIEQGLTITNGDGVLAHLILTDKQMLIESLLFKESAVKDVAQFDSLMMHAQKRLPLTSVGKTVLENQSYYVAFGALSASSKLENVELEIVLLFQNINEILQFSTDLLN